MTDDQTQQYDTTPAAQPPAPGAAAESAPGAAAESAPNAAEAFTPATATPVTATPGGGSRARWFVAIGVAVVAIGAAIGAFLLLNSPKSPEALAYVPADAAMVVELRPELPGDQLQQLGNFLAHFPGFADQSTLDQKVDQALTLLFARAGGGIDYATRVKPWLSGPAFLAVRSGPAAPDAAAMGTTKVLVSATTNGQITCATTLQGQSTTPETYNGTELLIISGSEFGCAIQGRQGLLGDRDSLHKALDAKAGGSGMDKAASYTKARASLKGDRLATMYFDFKKYMALLEEMSGALTPGASNPFAAMGVQFPDWAVAGLRAEGDAIVMDTVAPVPAVTAGSSMLPAAPAHASGIATLVPADAVAYVEAQGAGISLRNLITQLRTVPEIQDQLQMLEGMTSLDGLVGWIQDAGIVVTGSTSPTVSVVLLAADDAAAAEKGGSLNTVIGLLQMSGGQGIEVSNETVNGVNITTLTITDLGALTGGASLPGATGPVQVSFAVKGKAIIFGVGDGAVAKLVNVQAGSTLADDAAFKRVAARGVSPSASTVYLAIPKLVELIEANVPASDLTEWSSSIKPYIAPFEALYFVSEADGDLGESTAILTVKKQ